MGAGVNIEDLRAGAELRAAGGEVPDHLLRGDAAPGHRPPPGLAPPPLRQGVQEARTPGRRHGQAGQQYPGGHNIHTEHRRNVGQVWFSWTYFVTIDFH